MTSFPDPDSLTVPRLGAGRFASPLRWGPERFVDEVRRIVIPGDTVELEQALAAGPLPAFEPAGPRARIFFDPRATTCGVVTCGGLCPGINDVIRALVLILTYGYGVRRILGFRYGYHGLTRERREPIELGPDAVDTIHEHGGTMLGSSRGACDVGEMVDTLASLDVQVLFAIGGDGTLRGARALTDEIARRGLDIAVIGVPKTIDNDITWLDRSFGFSTAVEEASRVLVGAHTEARGAWNGVGLVKLMGRHSGFIAAHATLSNADVNFCLVPEVPFALGGDNGFLRQLERRLEDKHHAVVVVAEGCGQDLLEDARDADRDLSGNVKLPDIGTFLRDRLKEHFRSRQIPITIKYIDPSYVIRSLPACAFDNELCLMLGHHAAHAGMAGCTGVMIGRWNRSFTHVPLALCTATRKRLDPTGETWQRVLDATGQPAAML